jgi:predicted regulator of Ras-like GTPase activity (Roadblock/LC7/MglB family)
MFSLPLLISDDIAAVDSALADFIAASGAQLALFIDGGGFIVTRQGEPGDMDLSTLGALAANSFAATQAIAKLIEEHTVSSLYQEGDDNSLLIMTVGDFGFLAVVFPANIGVGSVKFFSQETIQRINSRLTEARLRAPDKTLDLSALNMADTGPLFRRKAAKA